MFWFLAIGAIEITIVGGMRWFNAPWLVSVILVLNAIILYQILLYAAISWRPTRGCKNEGEIRPHQQPAPISQMLLGMLILIVGTSAVAYLISGFNPFNELGLIILAAVLSPALLMALLRQYWPRQSPKKGKAV
jgi:hypothetical protein